MAESYEGFYGGGVSALSPEYGNLNEGYQMSAANLGFPGSPQSANQVQDTVNAIKHGTKTFEVTMLQPDVGESIPIQHFEEMRALMKLTGVKPSVHGPLLDAAGFVENAWGKEGMREDNERRIFDAIERAQILDPSGNLPFVIHAANGAPGTEWRPGDEKKGEDKFVMERATMINQETGQLQAINRDYQFRPGSDPTKSYDAKGREVKGGTPGILFDAEGSIESANSSDWKNKMTEVAQMNKHAEELIGAAPMNLAEYNNAAVVGQTKDGLKVKAIGEDGKLGEDLPVIKMGTGQGDSYNQMRKADLFLHNAELSFGGAFHQAYKHGSPEQQKELVKLSNNYENKMGSIHDSMIFAPSKKKEILDSAIMGLQEITKKRHDEKGKLDKNYGAPKVFALSEDFAMDKAAKTFGNLATKSYDKFGEKAPVLAVENMYQGMAFSRAEDMRDLIKKSRENFVGQLVEKGVGKKKAEKLAEDKLGVTWDVGHLNIMRKTGFGKEDIIEQTRVITKDKSMVKHVHLTDNFGYADTHLVPGMGNVPVKEILLELEKTGRFDEMRKITEAGGVVQHFKKLPHSMTLAAFGSGIYGMKNGPTWGQAMNVQGDYFGGYGNLNPQTHHSYFGAGFTTMPVELGGQMPGGQSRFGGAPMA